MDSDCLIKFTKAGIKEVVSKVFTVFITGTVVRETVGDAKAKGHPDSRKIEENIKSGTISVKKRLKPIASAKAEYEVLEEFIKGGFDAIISDDSKFIRALMKMNIPYLTAATVIFHMYEEKKIDKDYAMAALEKLREYINEEQYLAVRRLL